MKNIVRAILALASIMCMASAVVAGSLDRHITFHNNYSRSITEIYATNVHRNTWGYNLLRTRIQPGHELYLNLNDHSGLCIYDLKVVAGDGTTQQAKYNVCSESDFYFNP